MKRNHKAHTVYFKEEQYSRLKEASEKSKVKIAELIRTAVDKLLASDIPTWK